MANKRLPMDKNLEILRLRLEQGLSNREIGRALGISAGRVGQTVSRAKRLGWSWTQVQSMQGDEVERQLYGSRGPVAGRPLPDCEWIARELKRPGVTLALLHLEYLQQHPEGLRYTAFCNAYRRWKRRRRPTMRQAHKAGGLLAAAEQHPIFRPDVTTGAAINHHHQPLRGGRKDRDGLAIAEHQRP